MNTVTELLDKCRIILSEGNNNTNIVNSSAFPTVIIFLGKVDNEYVSYIKNVLDENWRNAKFIEWINIVKNKNGYNSYILDKESDDISWVNSGADWKLCINNAVHNIKQVDAGNFSNMRKVKLDFIYADMDEKTIDDIKIDDLDNSSFEIIDMMSQIEDGLDNHFNDYIATLYLLVDQSPAYTLRTEKLLKYVDRKFKEKYFRTIYVISNGLENGSFLGPDRLWMNYRLIADIVLLGGNEDRTDLGNIRQVVYNGIKTAAYAIVSKKNREIASCIIKRVVQETYKKGLETAALNQDMLKKRLGITVEGEIDWLNDYYVEKVCSQFPKIDVLLYLPYSGHNVKNGLIKRGNVSREEVEEATYGVFGKLIETQYLDKINKLDESDLKNIISKKLKMSFNIFEILKVTETDMLDSVFSANYYDYGYGGREGYEQRLINIIESICKYEFYKKAMKLMKDEFIAIQDKAKKIIAIQNEVSREVDNKYMFSTDDNLNVYYENVVDEYLRYHDEYTASMMDNDLLFNAEYRKNEYIDALEKLFENIKRSKDIFTYNFEDEIGERLEDMTKQRMHLYVRNLLTKELNGSMRLMCNAIGGISKKSEYFLVNEDAKYAKYLEEQKNEDSAWEYKLFNLNRKDCMEQVIIYNVDDLTNVI